jgi:hypothetical protein
MDHKKALKSGIIAATLVVAASLVTQQQQVYAWQLTVDVSDSDFGDDRACASVEGGYGYGPDRLCTQAGRNAEVTFNIGDGIGEGENYIVCGYSDILEYLIPSCDHFSHGSGDEWVSASA